MEIYGMSGEKLGSIGAPSEQLKESLPEWKKAFKSLPSISTRKGIASNFDTPYEDTATIVLTVPSGKFVDIRLPLGFGYGDTDIAAITKHPSFWAFSGTVRTTFLEPFTTSSRSDAVTMPYSAHAVFEHDLDSKGSGIVDEGDMFLLPNGDTMEVGIWTNPSTGKYEMYKEYWTEPEPSAGMGRLDHNTNGPESQLSKSPVVVAETTSTEKGRGIFIHVGDFAQGIYQPSDSSLPLLFTRYERREYPELIGGHDHEYHDVPQWQKDPRSTGNEYSFPINLVLDHYGNGKVGDTAHARDTGNWQIIEIWRET